MNSLYTLHFVGTKAEVSQQPTGQCTSDSPTELLAHGRRRKDQTCSPVAGLQFRIVSTVGVHGPEQRENTSGTDTDQHLKNKNQGDVSFPKPIKDNGKESSQTHGSHVCVFFANTVTDRSCKNHSHNIGSLSHCQIKAAQHKRNAKERNTLSTYRMTFAYIGSFIALLLFMPMVNLFGGAEDEQRGWMLSVVVIAVMCAALFYLCFALTRERVKPIREVQNSLKDDLKDLLHNRPWWILLGAGVAALVFNSIRDGATVYYFKYFVVEEDYSTVSFFGVSYFINLRFRSIRFFSISTEAEEEKPS